MTGTVSSVQCSFCRIVHGHWDGCPAVVGTSEAKAVWQQAYDYAYWRRDLRQEVLHKRSQTFRVGYMIGKSDRDFDQCQDEMERFENLRNWHRITKADFNG